MTSSGLASSFSLFTYSLSSSTQGVAKEVTSRCVWKHQFLNDLNDSKTRNEREVGKGKKMKMGRRREYGMDSIRVRERIGNGDDSGGAVYFQDAACMGSRFSALLFTALVAELNCKRKAATTFLSR